MDDGADVVSVFLLYPIRKRISHSGASFSLEFQSLSTTRGLFSYYGDNIVAGLEVDALKYLASASLAVASMGGGGGGGFKVFIVTRTHLRIVFYG